MKLLMEKEMPELRDKLGQLLWQQGITPALVKRTARKGRFALAMHGVSPAFDPTLPTSVQPHHDAKEMRLTLSWLKDHFQFLTPREFLETDQPGVLLTFDDGFANNVEILLPILEEFNAPAVFFVTLQHILTPRDWLPATRRLVQLLWQNPEDVPEMTARAFFDGMTVSQLQTCGSHPLVTIASHTIGHPFLSKCSQSELEHEILGSKQMLEEWLGQSIDLFAYPTGDYDERTLRQVQQAGYTAAFAVDPLNYGSQRFEIPRVGLYASDFAYLGLKLSGLHRRPLRGKILLHDSL